MNVILAFIAVPVFAALLIIAFLTLDALFPQKAPDRKCDTAGCNQEANLPGVTLNGDRHLYCQDCHDELSALGYLRIPTPRRPS